MKNRIEMLLQTVDNLDQLLILPHHNPDPDAVASAAALCFLLTSQANINCQIAYTGFIGRAENKAFVEYLNQPLTPLADLPAVSAVALVDTQPGAGNIILPPEANVLVVIDHHARQAGAANVPFADIWVEPGATSTILVEYFKPTPVDLPKWLATALFYGIKTNTMGLGRNASTADAAAYYYLQPKIDVEALAAIEQARVPPQYFKSFDMALRNAQIYNGLIISDLGSMDYPDLVAEIADLLLRLERARWVVCFGVYEQSLNLSVRTRTRRDNAERLALALVRGLGAAGGHGTIAGGQIPLAGQNPEQLASRLVQRLLRTLDIAPDTSGDPLF